MTCSDALEIGILEFETSAGACCFVADENQSPVPAHFSSINSSILLRPFRFGQMALASIKFLEWLFGSCFSSSWTAAREAGSFGVRTEEEEVPRAPDRVSAVWLGEFSTSLICSAPESKTIWAS
jgi:hypothetical protein